MATAWNKGLTKNSDERVKKYSKTLEKRIVSEDHKEKISKANTGKKRSEEQKKKLSERLSGELNPFYGKHHTSETNNKISKANKGRKFSEEVNKKKGLLGELNPMFGKQHSDETKAKISENHRDCKGDKNPMYHQGYKIKGDKNGSWFGGVSFIEYGEEFNETLRNKIRTRDKFTCVVCHKNGYVVHHIDYNKKNNLEENLITLCTSDHAKTNFNRDSWQDFFKPLINKLYEHKIK